MNRTLRSFLPFLAVLLFACAADYVYPVHVMTDQSCEAEYSGDSLVEQSGDRLQRALAEKRTDGLKPLNCTIHNHGYPGQMARHALAGLNGASQPTGQTFAQLMATSKAKVVIVAWGANEALHGIPAAEYKARMLDILATAKGKHVVIESPPLLTNPQGGAPELVIEYRALLHTLPQKDANLGIDLLSLTVVDKCTRQDWWDGGGIHPTDAHYWERARDTATVLLKL